MNVYISNPDHKTTATNYVSRKQDHESNITEHLIKHSRTITMAGMPCQKKKKKKKKKEREGKQT